MAQRQAFHPLTFPISCGPGSIAAAITVIFKRLSAFILLCLGVQIMWDGVYELGIGLLRDGMTPLPA